MHAIALIGGPLTFSWDALALAAGLYVVTGMFGVSLSFHRQLSHLSFRTPKWVEFALAYCGVLAFEGDPVEWCVLGALLGREARREGGGPCVGAVWGEKGDGVPCVGCCLGAEARSRLVLAAEGDAVRWCVLGALIAREGGPLGVL